jgi:NADH-quinone oxidoreductase subunit J
MNALVTHGPDILFYVFAALALVSALGVVTMRNPMYGALCLLTTFLSIAVLFLLLEAEFVAVVQIFVYGGGIMVLFLFVIMLINLHRLPQVKLFAGQSPLAGVLAVVMLGFFAYFFIVRVTAVAAPRGAAAAARVLGNPQDVAMSLYRDYLLPFEIASLFLLVAMIGAVVLGRRQ